MSAALSIFKLSVQCVRQLQQHRIEVSFETRGLPYQWTSVANRSILEQVSLQLGNVGQQCSSRYCTSCTSHM